LKFDISGVVWYCW